MNTYDLGDVIKCMATFTNTSGTAVDPATITFKAKVPRSGTITTYVYSVDPQLIKEDTGVYYVHFVPTTHGEWYYRWAGTGANAAAAEKTFNIRDSAFD